jgi:hypothetical protein
MADNPNRLAGVAFLSVNGQSYMLAGDCTYGCSSVKRESLVGQDGVHGFSETPVAGFISGTLRDAGDLSVASINAMSDVSVVVELANGKTIIGRNMWTVEAQEVKTMDATFEVRWEGFSVEEA